MARIAHLPAQAYVYVIGAPDGPQKVGVAADVNSRRAMLQTGNPVGLVVAHKVEVSRQDAFFVERYAHDLLSGDRVRGEWFDVSPEEAIDAVNAAYQAFLQCELDAPVDSSALAWQLRLKRAGLSQAELARLAGVRENTVSDGLRGLGKKGVPTYLRTIIRLWEVANRQEREAILENPETGADD